MRRLRLALLILFLPLLMAPDCVSYGAGNPLDPSDCAGNVGECLGSRLGLVPGDKWGRSVCTDCLEVCEGEGYWPDRQRTGKDCRWWLYQDVWAVSDEIDAAVEP
ncbi:hypothetical protein Hoch_5923 [Haliangium ochraceum DSM 14365]|uniref:Secreted protein n=1 Tax=Haliangium ochraceum (strain DSM 14365 / JCM 11303 / SMP-2) TaxID=502025 RepID=D0LIP2_HALO1|nr:hypothetical protein Hoch_5923 [Haliangium ochraceum DSM 14365]